MRCAIPVASRARGGILQHTYAPLQCTVQYATQCSIHRSVRTAPRDMPDTDSGLRTRTCCTQISARKKFQQRARACNMCARGMCYRRACNIGSLCIMSCRNKFNLDHTRTGCGCWRPSRACHDDAQAQEVRCASRRNWDHTASLARAVVLCSTHAPLQCTVSGRNTVPVRTASVRTAPRDIPDSGHGYRTRTCCAQITGQKKFLQRAYACQHSCAQHVRVVYGTCARMCCARATLVRCVSFHAAVI